MMRSTEVTRFDGQNGGPPRYYLDGNPDVGDCIEVRGPGIVYAMHPIEDGERMILSAAQIIDFAFDGGQWRIS